MKMDLAVERCSDQFEYRYQSYKTMLFRITYMYMENVHDTEDILQKAFLKLYECKKKFASAEDEKRWLIRVTINLCKDEKRSFWNRKRQYMDALPDLVETEQDRTVQMALSELPDKYKSCIYLHYIEGYSVAEMADILHISESAVKMRLKRGRERLKLELEESV